MLTSSRTPVDFKTVATTETPIMTYVQLSQCEFHRERRQLSIQSKNLLRDPTRGGFPREVLVHSHHTGREILFRPVGPEHRLYDEDHWDGEQQIYAHAEAGVRNVETLVVYHG